MPHFPNLKGGIISVTIGIAIYFLFIRTCLMKKNEAGVKEYINAWPQWLDIENLIYRPLIQHIIPFVMAFVLRIVDRSTDHLVSIFSRTVFKEVKEKRPLMFGNWFTHLAGVTMDGISRLLNNTVRKKHPVNKNYELNLADVSDSIARTSRLTVRSVSFGLLMFGIGLIFTMIYLLVDILK